MKMKNKILIKIIVPEINQKFDLFIPVNESIWKVKKLLLKSIQDLSNNILVADDEYALINVCSSREYKNNEIVIDTDIRNTSELILLSMNIN